MIETQMVAFLALAGLMGHALFVMINDGGADASPTSESDDTGPLWTSERFGQSGEGHDRPFFLD